MKKGFQIAMICTFVLAGLISSAAADTFGDNIASKLCSEPPYSDQYTMTESEESVWNESHEGKYPLFGGIVAFMKDSKADIGTCYMRRLESDGYVPSYAQVYREGKVLKRSKYVKSTEAP